MRPPPHHHPKSLHLGPSSSARFGSTRGGGAWGRGGGGGVEVPPTQTQKFSHTPRGNTLAAGGPRKRHPNSRGVGMTESETRHHWQGSGPQKCCIPEHWDIPWGQTFHACSHNRIPHLTPQPPPHQRRPSSAGKSQRPTSETPKNGTSDATSLCRTPASPLCNKSPTQTA